MNIAVGIPVTKVAYLDQALRSIACQSMPVSEVIVVDNVADGDVLAIVNREYPKAKFFKNETRLLPVENWNRVISYVNSEWFILLSDDDYLAPNHIAQLARVETANPDVGLIHTRVFIVDEGSNVTDITPLAAARESCYDLLMHRQLGYRIQFLSDFAWKTGIFYSVGGFADMPSAWGTDDLTAFRVAKIAGVAYGAEPTFYYRMHANNITHSDSIYNKLMAICALEDAFRSELIHSPSNKNKSDDCEDFVRDRCIELMPNYRGRMQLYVLSNAKFRVLFGVLVSILMGRSSFRISLRIGFVAIVRRLAIYAR